MHLNPRVNANRCERSEVKGLRVWIDTKLCYDNHRIAYRRWPYG